MLRLIIFVKWQSLIPNFKLKMKSKKVVICASISFWNEIVSWKEKLEKKGYEVIKYPDKISGDFLSSYKKEFSEHYEKITETDILFVLNIDKNNINGYIGPSVFAEIAFAIGLNVSLKKNIEVFCLNSVPKNLPHSTELDLWEKLGWIKQWK